MGSEFKAWCKFSFRIIKFTLLAWAIFCTFYVSAHIVRAWIGKPIELGRMIDFDPPPKVR